MAEVAEKERKGSARRGYKTEKEKSWLPWTMHEHSLSSRLSDSQQVSNQHKAERGSANG